VSRSWRVMAGVVLGLVLGAVSARAQGNAHTDPLNLDPVVRQGYEHFYNLDFDGALGYFNKVTQAHPNEPMAWN